MKEIELPDTVRILRAVAADTHLLLKAAEWLPSFTHPALVVWASRDRVMPLEYGRPTSKR